MTALKDIQDFLQQKNIAVVGVSRNRFKLANRAYYDLRARGYHVFPVNPHVEMFEGKLCYPNLLAIPEPVDGALIVVPPAVTEKVVQYAAMAEIRRIWLQQGSETDKAIRFCEDHGMTVIHHECIMMFIEPVRFHHYIHRWLWRRLGKYP
ncbi:MAG TPA: CoA-binding protein, partial [bacterium]|nr:CoA-binding protein [bacterium]